MSVLPWVVVVALGVALFLFSVYAFAEGGRVITRSCGCTIS